MKSAFTPTTEFKSGVGDVVSFNDVIKRIDNFIGNDDNYTIEVGTDSQTNGQTKFVTAIVIHRIGKGGIFFYYSVVRKQMKTLRDRIYAETQMSINCATELIELFLNNDILRDVTIHCDVGENGKTKELIREVVGYVTSSGFSCSIKPDAIAACSVADRLSK